jgi:hypothetical protein
MGTHLVNKKELSIAKVLFHPSSNELPHPWQGKIRERARE